MTKIYKATLNIFQFLSKLNFLCIHFMLFIKFFFYGLCSLHARCSACIISWRHSCVYLYICVCTLLKNKVPYKKPLMLKNCINVHIYIYVQMGSNIASFGWKRWGKRKNFMLCSFEIQLKLSKFLIHLPI